MFDFLSGAAGETLRGWLTTVGGMLALSVATLTYRRNVKIRREEQARLVYTKITHVEILEPGARTPRLPNEAKTGADGGGVIMVVPESPDEESQYLVLSPVIQATVVIHNGSKELIGPAKVQMVNAGTGQTWNTSSVRIDAVEPESNYVVAFAWPNEFHPGQPSLGATVIFRDASGQWWRRHRLDPIERVHDDPENQAPTPAERALYAEQARAFGLEPTPEQKLSRRVRMHRRLRRLRGKHPIP